MTRTDGARDTQGRRADGSKRLAALGALAASLAGGAVLATVPAPPAPRSSLQPAALASEAAPASSVSSSWYCPGGPAELAGTTHVLLANAARSPARVALEMVDARGVRRQDLVRLAPHAESDVVPGRLLHGAWVATTVDVAGGAVSATELVVGRRSSTLAPCSSEVSSRWYFASGSTLGGSTLTVNLFNPTPDLAVVDLGFVTSSGFSAPAPFQGLVVEPGRLRTFTVGAFVQNQAAVATVVDARSGAIVAGELELYGPGGAAGASLTLGAPATSRRWDLPSVEDASQGSSDLAVLNPSGHRVRVVVGVRLPTGPVRPFTDTLGPRSEWNLATSAQLRVPSQEPYTLEVRATSPGVVVARLEAGAPAGPDPWWAEDVSVSALETTSARAWLVPGLPSAPGPTMAAEAPAASGRAPGAVGPVLVVANPTRAAVAVRVLWWSPRGRRRRLAVQVPAGGRVTLRAPRAPAVVQASGPIAVMGDASPAGTAGVVGIPAVPLSS